ncbi:hypothetical protein [Allopusillimonas soli]|uniref:Uncharacterized protein n=1 Tax=Allopusillimonas soli TaxID=659016 RepID=A0A853F8H9_9BURK|nr:hypothetical protein [Allopusillimonas soli]NYT36954.1 hypothetical protein [Allopusillimonas soli]
MARKAARKITQIAATVATPNQIPMALALANDGTVWKIRLSLVESDAPATKEWVQLPDLPEALNAAGEAQDL